MHNRITDWAIWLQDSDPFVPPSAEINTIGDIERVCPAVRQILNEARSVRHRRRADWDDYEFFKSLLKSQVGWWAKDERLQTCKAYELSIKALTDALHI